MQSIQLKDFDSILDKYLNVPGNFRLLPIKGRVHEILRGTYIM